MAVAALGRSLLIAVLVSASTATQALTISPVLVELSPARRVVSITIANPSDQPIRFQTQILAWTQRDGVDRYSDTDDLLVVPPIAQLAPGSTQIFRIASRRPAAGREQAYRLIFEDVTETTAPSSSSDEVSVNLRVNHNLPVFIVPAGKARPQPRLGPCTNPPSTVQGCVRLDNDGSRYVQIRSLTFDAGDWHKELLVNTRVLAGASRQWLFDLPPQTSGPVKVSAQTLDEPISTDLPIPAR